MKIEIRSFADKGDFESERMSLRATANVDLGAHAIFYLKLNSNGKPSSGKKVAYWFPDLELKTNDLVVVYTKKGERRTKTLDDGTTAHFFYWGLDKPIWNQPGAACSLLAITEWTWKASTPFEPSQSK